MRAGSLRERVTFQRLAVASDPRWGESSAWGETSTVAAEVLPLGGDESFETKAVSTSQRYRVRVRYSPSLADLTSKDRIVWRGRTLDITSVIDPDGRQRELVIEGVAHGAS